MSGPLGPLIRNIGSISRWFLAIVLRDVQDDKMGFLPTGLPAGGTGVSPETTTGFDPFEGISRGNDLQFLLPQWFCSPLPPQPGSHTSTAPSSLANFVGCHLFFPLCFSVHGLCEFLKLFLFFPSLFGVESSYFSYSDSSPLLSHVEMSSQLSFLDVCFFAIVLCILGHTRSQWESTFLHKLLEFLYQLGTSKVKIFFPIVTH